MSRSPRKFPRNASDRLARLGEKQIAAWLPVELLSKLDEKLARQWVAHPDRPRPSRQQFIVEAVRKFVESSTDNS